MRDRICDREEITTQEKEIFIMLAGWCLASEEWQEKEMWHLRGISSPPYYYKIIIGVHWADGVAFLINHKTNRPVFSIGDAYDFEMGV